ncbi:uncharacterized protein [Ptychodera flava]|uniref:uncharacterized protein n=1 Tax=Ptychodera flava TaxID=63121 RepID=UPI003969BB8D
MRHTTRWDQIDIRGDYNETLNWSIVVLTMNRPASLRRLLNSLQEAEYDGDTVQLVIWIDYRDEEAHDETLRIVNTFHFRHGPRLIYERRESAGLARAWFDAWVPRRKDEHAIVIEDDSEVSRYFYRWLKQAWAAYGTYPGIGGMSLNRQTVRAIVTPGPNVPITNDYKPFLYKLVGTFAFAPHPVHWKSYVEWVRRSFYTMEPLVDGLRTTDWWLRINKNENIWEQWFIYYCYQHDLFVLYMPLPHRQALVVNYAEHGEHHPSKKAGGNRSVAAYEWSEYLQTFPKKLVHYDWDTSPMTCPKIPECRYWEKPPIKQD